MILLPNTLQMVAHHRNKDKPRVWRWTIRAILLHVHSKKAHLRSIDLLKSKYRLCAVRKCRRHLSSVAKPSFHCWFQLEYFVVRRQHTDDNFASPRILTLQHLIDTVLQVAAQFRCRQTCSHTHNTLSPP